MAPSNYDEKHIADDTEDSDGERVDSTDEKAGLLSSTEPTPQTTADSEPASSYPHSLRKKFLVCFFVTFVFCLGYVVTRPILNPNRQVIHASRYSKDYKFRPAASPIITETLKDGRIRVRGALPTPTPQPAAVTKKVETGNVSGRKKKGRKLKRKFNPSVEKKM